MDGRIAAHRELTRRRVLQLMGAGVSAAWMGPILAACGSSSTSSGGKLPETLTWALPGPVLSLDYSLANVTSNYSHPMSYESLLVYDWDGSLKPQLATSWQQTDPQTYVYKLRSGVKFWDGSDLTVDDVIASWTRTRDPAIGQGWSSFFNSVASMDATGTNELTVRLKNPDPLFKFIPGFGGSRISSRKFIEAHMKDFGTSAEATMGTGPYKFTEYVKDDHVTLQPTGKYWAAAPSFKTIAIRSIADANNKLLAMRSGQIDGTFNITLDQADLYKAIPNVSTLFAPEFSVYYFAMDSEKPPFDDIHFRRALAYSVDRKGLVASVLHGYGIAASALPSPDQWVGMLTRDQVDKFYASLADYRNTFDLTKAKQELSQSKYPTGMPGLFITYTNADQARGLFCQNLSQNLKQIGVSLEVRELPATQDTNVINSRLNNIYVAKWSNVTGDASEIPSAFFGSATATKNQYNVANLKDPKIDSMLSQERSTLDPVKRGGVLQNIIKAEAEFCGWIPIVWPQTVTAIKNKFTFDRVSTWARWEDWAGRIHAK
jgi:peptide/nickel transport system substrate-binding protein